MKFDAERNVYQLSTWDVIKGLFTKKSNDVVKEPAFSKTPLPAPNDVEVNYIAVVLDGQVQEVIRAEAKLAALLLSEPEFIAVADAPDRPTIGWKYSDGVFEQPSEDYLASHHHAHTHGHAHEH